MKKVLMLFQINKLKLVKEKSIEYHFQLKKSTLNNDFTEYCCIFIPDFLKFELKF